MDESLNILDDPFGDGHFGYSDVKDSDVKDSNPVDDGIHMTVKINGKFICKHKLTDNFDIASVLKNIISPPIDLFWSLTPPATVGSTTMHRQCPDCDGGILPVSREPDPPYRLSEMDTCLLCARRIRWLDIQYMREEDGIL